MKRTLGLVAALVLSGSLVAAPAGADTAQAKVLSKTQLRHALLTVNDLPKGFKVDRSASKKSNDDVDVSSSDPACQDLLDMTEPARSPGQVSEAGADFKRERDSIFDASYEGVTVDLTAYGSAAAVRKDFATHAPQFGACHTIAMDMGEGTTLSFKVASKVRRVEGHRTFVLTMHTRYMGIPMNMVMTVSQVKNYEVATLLMGANKSTTYVARLDKSLLRAQVAKLTQHLR